MDYGSIINTIKDLVTMGFDNARNLVTTLSSTIYPENPMLVTLGLVALIVYIFRDKSRDMIWYLVVVAVLFILLGGI